MTRTLSLVEAVDGGTPTSSLNAFAIVIDVDVDLGLIDVIAGLYALVFQDLGDHDASMCDFRRWIGNHQRNNLILAVKSERSFRCGFWRDATGTGTGEVFVKAYA
jgi:hypothetical protein